MSHSLRVLVLVGTLSVGAQAPAADSTNQSPVSKRQMIVQMVDCMKQRMAADKSRSYNETMKACKGEMNRGTGSSPSGTLVASETSPKH